MLVVEGVAVAIVAVSVGWLRNYSTWPGVGAVRHVDSRGVVDSLSSVYLRWEFDFRG